MTQNRSASEVDSDSSTADAPAERARGLRWMPVIWIIPTVIAWFRVPSGLRDNLYAEDGFLFVGDWLRGGGIGLLWEPYAGYQHLLPRVGSWFVVTFLPVVSWGYAVTAVSCVLVGLVAMGVYALSADVVTFWPARVVLGLLVVLVPVAGNEPLGNLANVHWFMLMLMPWALMAQPRTRWGLVVVALATLTACLTEPTCILFAPLALWRFIVVRRSRLIVVAWTLGVGVQMVTTLISPRPRAPGQPSWRSLVLGYVRDVGLATVTARPRVLGFAINSLGWWVGFAWVLVLVVLATWAAWGARRDVRVLLAALLLGSVASWSAAFLANNNSQFLYSLWSDTELATTPVVRWGTASSAMLASAVPVAVSALVARHRRLRSYGGVLLGVIVALGLAGLPTRTVADIRPWSQQVEDGTVQCRTSSVPMHIDNPPDSWNVDVPCSYALR